MKKFDVAVRVTKMEYYTIEADNAGLVMDIIADGLVEPTDAEIIEIEFADFTVKE